MLPLHSNDKPYKPGWRIKERISGWLRLILATKASRNLFFFLLLNLSMAFVELIYGVWTNSLGLISDSFHMFFDCTALLAGLVASLIARWRPNDKYPHGYVRAEILAGFVNGLFLVFIAFFIFSEAVERMFEPPEIHHDRLFLISVLGFFVNLIGIFAFQHGGAHHGHSHGNSDSHGHSHTPTTNHGHSHNKYGHSHGHSHDNHGNHDNHGHGHSHDQVGDYKETHALHLTQVDKKHLEGTDNKIFQGVFLHILADTLGSVGVIISSSLIHLFGWMIADPICSMFIAVLIAFSVIPLVRDSMAVLMQRQPKELDNSLPSCFNKITNIEGVYSVQDPHFWTLCSDVFIGGVKLEVSPEADHRYILTQAQGIFNNIGIRQVYIQIDTAPS